MALFSDRRVTAVPVAASVVAAIAALIGRAVEDPAGASSHQKDRPGLHFGVF
jgi:hypothetical protein